MAELFSISRPSTSWTLLKVLSIAFFAHLRRPYLCGRGSRKLPSWISKNTKHIISLEQDRSRNMIRDSLCMIRCLSWFFTKDPFDKQVRFFVPFTRFRIRADHFSRLSWPVLQNIKRRHDALISISSKGCQMNTST